MSLFKSGNPTLSENRFRDTVLADVITHENAMTLKGTLNKFGFLFLMVLGTSFYSWKEFADGGNVVPLMWTGALGGLVVAIVLVFKNNGRLTWLLYMPCWKDYLWEQSHPCTILHLQKKLPILLSMQ